LETVLYSVRAKVVIRRPTEARIVQLTNDRPDLSSERAPQMDRTASFTKKKTSGHEPQLGLDTKTNRLTDRQLQHDFDFEE
jgi:hypothetical protein